MLSIKLFNFVFRPRLVPTVATILIFPILLSLGFWQLHRGEDKQALERQFTKFSNSAPISYQTAISGIENHEFQNIKLTGNYINNQQLLLENRFYQHQLGYEVITPLKLADETIVLINRGWIPRPMDNTIPTIKPINGEQNIVGRIILPRQKMFTLGAIDYSKLNWPKQIPNLSSEILNQAIPSEKLASFIVQLDPKDKNGFIREWKPVTLSPKKHFGYAVQWFAMAGTLLIIFITVNTRRRTSDGSADSTT